MQPRVRGFTLVELLIVLAVLAVISAIAIPYFMSAVQRSREAAAVGYLRHIQAAQENYRIAHKEYADNFTKLTPYMTASLESPTSPGGMSDSFLVAVALAAPRQGGTPPGQGGTPPGQGGTPPGQGGTPPGQGGTPPGQGGTPPGQVGAPAGGAASGGAPGEDTVVNSMYIFRLVRPQPLRWECTAEPLRDRTRNKFFYTDNTNVIRFTIGSIPNASSPQI